jgi:hypothetical protein
MVDFNDSGTASKVVAQIVGDNKNLQHSSTLCLKVSPERQTFKTGMFCKAVTETTEQP